MEDRYKRVASVGRDLWSLVSSRDRWPSQRWTSDVVTAEEKPKVRGSRIPMNHRTSGLQVKTRERGGREGSEETLGGQSIIRPQQQSEKRKVHSGYLIHRSTHLTAVTDLMNEVLDSVASICTRWRGGSGGWLRFSQNPRPQSLWFQSATFLLARLVEPQTRDNGVDPRLLRALPHRFLVSTLHLDHDRQTTTTKGPQGYPRIEYGHRWPEHR